MLAEAKHIDLTSLRTRRHIRSQARRHAIATLIEVTLLAGVLVTVMHAISQTLLQSYEDMVVVSDGIEAERTEEEAKAWELEEMAGDGRSPLYIDHLSAQDRSWRPPEPETSDAESTDEILDSVEEVDAVVADGGEPSEDIPEFEFE